MNSTARLFYRSSEVERDSPENKFELLQVGLHMQLTFVQLLVVVWLWSTKFAEQVAEIKFIHMR